MQFGLILWNYIVLLLVMMYFIGNDCKKKKQSFTFEALMAGMNSKEKVMFKEELNKEVKRFRSQQKHHRENRKTAVASRKLTKKRKVRGHLPKMLPGICDPICAHECVHGCDFRCCIPGYQQLHKIPRPPPTVVLPGSCSLTCSPTCRPLCEESCCEGGKMFQSAKDLVTLTSRKCPKGCAKACYPKCTVACCIRRLSDKITAAATPAQPLSPAQQQKKHLEIHANYKPLMLPPKRAPAVSPVQVSRNLAPRPMSTNIAAQAMQLQARLAAAAQAQSRMTPLMLQKPRVPVILPLPSRQNVYFYTQKPSKCTPACPSFCAPLCFPSCCISGKRDYTPALTQSILLPPNFYHQQPNVITASMKTKIPISKMNCPVECFSSCNPTCEVRCCNLQPNILNQLNRASIHHADTPYHPYPQRPLLQASSNSMSVPPISETTNEQTLDTSPVTFGNVETIHALSKDMISKPLVLRKAKSMRANNGIVKNSIPLEKGPRAFNYGPIKKSATSQGAPNQFTYKQGERKSNILMIPARPPQGLIIKKSVMPIKSNVPKREPPKQTSSKRTEQHYPVLKHHPLVIPVIPGSLIRDHPSRFEASINYPHPIIKMIAKKYIVKPQLPLHVVDGLDERALDVKRDEVLMNALKSANDEERSTTPKHSKETFTAPTANNKKSSVPTHAHEIGDLGTEQEKRARVEESDTDSNNKLDVIISPTCPKQCPGDCAPACDKGCCNRQIVYQAFHKNQKKSKIAFQLDRLR